MTWLTSLTVVVAVPDGMGAIFTTHLSSVDPVPLVLMIAIGTVRKPPASELLHSTL
jgi:hypothetical protein